MKSNMKVLDHENQEFMVVAEKVWQWFCFLKYLDPTQMYKKELFAKIINGFQLLTIFTKRSILDV